MAADPGTSRYGRPPQARAMAADPGTSRHGRPPQAETPAADPGTSRYGRPPQARAMAADPGARGPKRLRAKAPAVRRALAGVLAARRRHR